MSLARLSALRLQRKRPQGFIVVTDLPHIVRNARKLGLLPVMVDWDKPLDMKPLHNLDVLMVAMDRDRHKTGPMGQAILAAEPKRFWAQYWRDDGEYWTPETEWIQR